MAGGFAARGFERNPLHPCVRSEVLTRLLDPWRNMARDPRDRQEPYSRSQQRCSGMPGKSGIGIAFEDMILEDRGSSFFAMLI